MQFAKPSLLLFFLVSAQAWPVQAREPQRWVPPPAPRIENGTAIVPVAEIFGENEYILHFPKPEQVDWRQTRYEIRMTRSDEQPLSVTLSTMPFVKDDEVVFVTIPKGSADKYVIEVIDKASYPYRRLWSGAIAEIKPIKD